MKTQTDKLTAHGCAIYRGEFQVASTFIDDTGTALPGQSDIDMASTFCKAVNEHEALCAVAEAANMMADCLSDVGQCDSEAAELLCKKLKTLAAIRKGAQ